MNTYKYLLLNLHYYKNDICQFTLKPENHTLTLAAGQYVLFHLPHGISAPFSIAGFQNQGLEFHVRVNNENTFVQAFLAHLHDYESIELSGPYGKCILPKDTTIPLIFAAGGTGIAPHKALIDEALQLGYGSIQLYWGIKNIEDLYLKSWLKACDRSPHFQATVVLSEMPENGLFQEGLVHDYVLQAPLLPHALLYASGPYEMVQALQFGYQQLGFKKCNLKSDMLDFNTD